MLLKLYAFLALYLERFELASATHTHTHTHTHTYICMYVFYFNIAL